MITRLWRGWTTVDNADAYEQFLLGELFPSMREIPGFRGADVLRRSEHDAVAFLALTRFDTVAAIQAFAGDDYETPVLEPRALALLARYGGERFTSIRQPSPPDAPWLDAADHPRATASWDAAHEPSRLPSPVSAHAKRD